MPKLVLQGSAEQIENLKGLKSVQKMQQGKASKIVVNKYTEWYKEQGLKVVRKDFTVELPIKSGKKKFKAIELSNGKIAVFCRGGSLLRYAWA